MRTFIAAEISEEQKNKLVDFQAALGKSKADLKLVERENLHITLRFLGEVSEAELEKVKSGLKRAVKGKKSFTMQIKGAGVFPNTNYIKVVWAGITKGSEELAQLAEKINSEIKIGKTDERGFSSHITVARVKSAKNKDELAKVLKEFSSFDFGETIVKEIKLKESKLSPKGPTYSDLGIEALG